MQTFALAVLLVTLFLVEIMSRWVRFKRTPSAWSSRVALLGAAIWLVAWLIVFRNGDLMRGVLYGVLFGSCYAAAILLIGRRVRRSTAR